MRMNLWSRDGTPVDGGTVVLGVTLNLKAQPQRRLSSADRVFRRGCFPE
jgi:hypothetical protein